MLGDQMRLGLDNFKIEGSRPVGRRSQSLLNDKEIQINLFLQENRELITTQMKEFSKRWEQLLHNSCIHLLMCLFVDEAYKNKSEKKIYSTSLLWSTFWKEMYKWNQHSDILAFTLEKQKHQICGAGLTCMKW